MKISFVIEPKRRSVGARVLMEPRFRKVHFQQKKKYTRKGRASSNKKFEDSFQPANGRGLIEPKVNRPMVKFLAGFFTAFAVLFAIALFDEPAYNDSFVDWNGGYDYGDTYDLDADMRAAALRLCAGVETCVEGIKSGRLEPRALVACFEAIQYPESPFFDRYNAICLEGLKRFEDSQRHGEIPGR